MKKMDRVQEQLCRWAETQQMIQRVTWAIATPEGRAAVREAHQAIGEAVAPYWAVVGQVYTCPNRCAYRWERTEGGWFGPRWPEDDPDGEGHPDHLTHEQFREQHGDCWAGLVRAYGDGSRGPAAWGMM